MMYHWPGYENKVKTNLDMRAQTLEVEDSIFEVGLHLVLVAGVALDYVPLARLLLQLAGQRDLLLCHEGCARIKQLGNQ